MKVITTIGKDISDERIEIYAKKDYPEINEIKRIAEGSQAELVGYLPDGSFRALEFQEIFCFSIIGGKLKAKTKSETYLVKKRLYEIETVMPNSFCKISQSCIVNLRHIELFELSVDGSLKCRFSHGGAEYVSRRFVKKLKERLGV